jgi:hypothetical protein
MLAHSMQTEPEEAISFFHGLAHLDSMKQYGKGLCRLFEYPELFYLENQRALKPRSKQNKFPHEFGSVVGRGPNNF